VSGRVVGGSVDSVGGTVVEVLEPGALVDVDGGWVVVVLSVWAVVEVAGVVVEEDDGLDVDVVAVGCVVLVVVDEDVVGVVLVVVVSSVVHVTPIVNWTEVPTGSSPRARRPMWLVTTIVLPSSSVFDVVWTPFTPSSVPSTSSESPLDVMRTKLLICTLSSFVEVTDTEHDRPTSSVGTS
jgi:hypothetical protein